MKYFSEEQIGKIRQGYYSAVYFNRTKEILLSEKNFKSVTMQIFQRKEGSILCGVEEVKELLRMATGYFERGGPASAESYSEAKWIDKSFELNVKSKFDGDKLTSGETVMHIEGPYAYFAHLESLYLGILARRTRVATNVKTVVEAAGGKPVIFFGDRFDHFLNQEGDGYAANIGGAKGVCTAAHTAWTGGEPVGTIPHAFIAVNSGQIEDAIQLFYKYNPQVNLIALVDFENDCVNTSIRAAKRMGNKLWGVRLDTSLENTDLSLKDHGGEKGVTPMLVRLVREALNREGFGEVKIVVSGGFTQEKIKKFTDEKVPVDAYGVGSAILQGENDFTADIVQVDGKPMAKAGREFKPIRPKDDQPLA